MFLIRETAVFARHRRDPRQQLVAVPALGESLGQVFQTLDRFDTLPLWFRFDISLFIFGFAHLELSGTSRLGIMFSCLGDKEGTQIRSSWVSVYFRV